MVSVNNEVSNIAPPKSDYLGGVVATRLALPGHPQEEQSDEEREARDGVQQGEVGVRHPSKLTLSELVVF